MDERLSRLKSARAGNILGAPKVDYGFLPGHQPFPMLLRPRAAGLIPGEWVKGNAAELEEKVKRHGAVLFRDFHIDTVERFQDFIRVFDAQPLEYKQRSSPRYEVARNVYHSTTYPADQPINMHSENSYARKWAMRILFCCIQPAAVQGETPIADTRVVLRHLREATREKFRELGVRYVRHIAPNLGLSWQEIFQTKDRAAVEEECRNSGMAYEWKDEQRLVLSWTQEAIHVHPVTGEEVWFNHAFFFNKYALPEEVLISLVSDDELPFNTFFGDGTPISLSEIEDIRSAYHYSTVCFPWQKGDLLYMDNMLTAHGRSPYEGDRQILVSML